MLSPTISLAVNYFVHEIWASWTINRFRLRRRRRRRRRFLLGVRLIEIFQVCAFGKLSNDLYMTAYVLYNLQQLNKRDESTKSRWRKWNSGRERERKPPLELQSTEVATENRLFR